MNAVRWMVALLLLAAAAAPAQLKFNQFKPFGGPTGTVERAGGETPAPDALPEPEPDGTAGLPPDEPAPADPASNAPARGPTPAGRANYKTGQKDRWHPRTRDEIRDAIKAIERRRVADYRGLAKLGKAAETQVAALNRLNAYRYLCGVSAEVTADAEQIEYAQAAAEICEKIGRLDHGPPNPGMPEAAYRKAATGAGRCNLFAGGGSESSVNGYMNDSDPGNIDRVGHRRWCLNPAMGKTGFGQSGNYSAMYSMDGSGGRGADVVAYPAPGYMLSRFFNAGYAWSVSLNPGPWRVPDDDRLQVAIYPTSHFGPADPRKRDDPLKLNYLHVDRGGYGLGLCIIFRPEEVDISPGNRYWVEIKGVAGPRATIEYLVEFVD